MAVKWQCSNVYLIMQHSLYLCLLIHTSTNWQEDHLSVRCSYYCLYVHYLNQTLSWSTGLYMQCWFVLLAWFFTEALLVKLHSWSLSKRNTWQSCLGLLLTMPSACMINVLLFVTSLFCLCSIQPNVFCSVSLWSLACSLSCLWGVCSCALWFSIY